MNDTHHHAPEAHRIHEKPAEDKPTFMVPAAIILAGLIIAAAVLYAFGGPKPAADNSGQSAQAETANVAPDEQAVLPSEGVELPVSWGNLGQELVLSGAIDGQRFKSLYQDRGAWSDEYQSLLFGENKGRLRINRANAGYILNLLWALGLANKNEILEKGEMSAPAYGGADRFASTAGWTMAKGSPMDHYSRHRLIVLTPEEQALVDKISRSIFRPCCGNSTHFPDCNHGMAMLALLELMASQGVSESDMYKAALAVNSYWFPDTYLTIEAFFKAQGVSWRNVDPKTVLGKEYSSIQGYRTIAAQVSGQASSGGGSGCGVEGGGAPAARPAQTSRQQGSGCGI